MLNHASFDPIMTTTRCINQGDVTQMVLIYRLKEAVILFCRVSFGYFFLHNTFAETNIIFHKRVC